MAIDLNRPIGQSKGPAAALPSKKSINLLVRESKSHNAWKYALVAFVLAALVALFAKFAVFDVYKQLDLKRAELHAAKQELAAVEKQAEGYDAVLEEYRSFVGTGQDSFVDALEVMDLVASVVEPNATVSAVSASGGMVQVNVKDIALGSLGQLADDLREDPLVEEVSVSAANEEAAGGEGVEADGESAREKSVSATLQITLVAPVEEEAEL